MTDQTTPGSGPSEPGQPPRGGQPGSTVSTATPGHPQAPPVDPPPAGQPRGQRPVFRRSSADKVIGGVAGGLARTFDQDPVVVRIIAVVLALAFPPAFIAYLAAWLLVARDDEPSRSTTGGVALRESGGVLFWVGVVILVAALFASFDDPFPFNGGFGLLPLVLIGIGVALWTRDGPQSRPSSATADWPATAPTTGAAMPATQNTQSTQNTQPTQSAPGSPPAAGGTPPPAQPPAARPTSPQPVPAGPPPPPRPKSPLGAITIGLALIATGVVAALDQVPGIPLDADPSHLAAVALLVLGVGQLVGAWIGRARWLSLVAIFLIPPVVLGAVVRGVDADFDLDGINLGDGVGERVLVIDGDEDLPRDVGLAAGTIEVDLRDWQPGAAALAALDGDEDLTVDVGAGEVTITTPSDVPWRVLGEVRLGEIRVTDASGDVERATTEDAGIPLDVELRGGPQDGDVLDIVVDVRLGELTIITTEHDTEELS